MAQMSPANTSGAKIAPANLPSASMVAAPSSAGTIMVSATGVRVGVYPGGVYPGGIYPMSDANRGTMQPGSTSAASMRGA